MSKKRYKVRDDSLDQNHVVLVVDTEKLTPELATEINEFWGGSKFRLEDESGDPVRCVLRMLGAALINLMREFDGCDSAEGPNWMELLVAYEFREGLPPLDELGVSVDSGASFVTACDFYGVSLQLLEGES